MKLIYSNKESMMALVMSLRDSFKRKTPTATGVTSADEIGTRVTKLTKPVKVSIWSKSMSLETFAKQLETWEDINEDILEFMSFMIWWRVSS